MTMLKLFATQNLSILASTSWYLADHFRELFPMDTVEARRREMGNLKDRAAAQAQMKTAIIDSLLEGLPDDYSSEDIDRRAEIIYQYVEGQMGSARVH